MSEETKTTEEQPKELPKQTVATVYTLETIPPNTPPAAELDRFNWSWGWDFQVKKQGLIPRHVADTHALHYIRVEKDYIEETEGQPEVKWGSEQEAIQAGLRKIECPKCFDSRVVRRNFVGKLTGLKVAMPVPCRCVFYYSFYTRWLNPAMVPTDYRNVTLRDLEKYRAAFKRFEKTKQADPFLDLVNTVKKYRHNCYLLTGPAGSGKTTLMVAMYHTALVNWCGEAFHRRVPTEAVWKINAPELSKQFRDWEMRDVGKEDHEGTPTKLPEVMVSKVQAALRAGYVPCLFLDEIDKIKLDSDFQAREFSAIIDAIQSNGGQIVASTNLSEEGLQKALGNQFGPAILRRLCGPRWNPNDPEKPADTERGGFLIDFWNGTIQQNYEIPLQVPKAAAEVRTQRTFNKGGGGKGKGNSDDPRNPKPTAETPQKATLPNPDASNKGNKGTISMGGPNYKPNV